MPSFDIILFQDLIYEDLQHLSLKLFLLLFLNNFALICCKFVQTFMNTGTMPCQMMAQVSK